MTEIGSTANVCQDSGDSFQNLPKVVHIFMIHALIMNVFALHKNERGRLCEEDIDECYGDPCLNGDCIGEDYVVRVIVLVLVAVFVSRGLPR